MRFCKLHRSARVACRCRQIVEHSHHCHRQPRLGLDPRLHVVARLGQGLAIERHCGAMVCFEDVGTREAPEGLRSSRTRGRRLRRVTKEVSRAIRVACLEVVSAGGDRSTEFVVRSIRGGQPDCFLRKLGRRGGRPASTRQPRRYLEEIGHVGRGPIRRERHVTRALLGIGDEAGEPPVKRSLLRGASRPVDGGGEQRMGEANSILVELDHVAFQRRLEPLPWIVAGRVGDELEGRLRQRRRGKQDGTSLGWKCREPLLDERRECPGERFAGLELDDPAPERAPELEREEWISTRELVEAAQLRT